MMAAAVTAAAVLTTVVTFAVVVVVMITLYIGVICQITLEESFHSGIRITADTTEQLDAGSCQRHLCTAADATADQHICI